MSNSSEQPEGTVGLAEFSVTRRAQGTPDPQSSDSVKAARSGSAPGDADQKSDPCRLRGSANPELLDRTLMSPVLPSDSQRRRAVELADTVEHPAPIALADLLEPPESLSTTGSRLSLATAHGGRPVWFVVALFGGVGLMLLVTRIHPILPEPAPRGSASVGAPGSAAPRGRLRPLRAQVSQPQATNKPAVSALVVPSQASPGSGAADRGGALKVSESPVPDRSPPEPVERAVTAEPPRAVPSVKGVKPSGARGRGVSAPKDPRVEVASERQAPQPPSASRAPAPRTQAGAQGSPTPLPQAPDLGENDLYAPGYY